MHVHSKPMTNKGNKKTNNITERRNLDPYKITSDKYHTNNIDLSKYKIPELKMIAKHNKLHVSGTKPVLIQRLKTFFKQSKCIVNIQAYYRGYLVRRFLKLNGPGFKNMKKCINDTDFYTMDPLDEIDLYHFFSYKDDAGFLYGFNIQSLINMIIKSNVAQNPYTRELFSDEVLNNILAFNRINYIIMISQEKLLALKCSRYDSISPGASVTSSPAPDLNVNVQSREEVSENQGNEDDEWLSAADISDDIWDNRNSSNRAANRYNRIRIRHSSARQSPETTDIVSENQSSDDIENNISIRHVSDELPQYVPPNIQLNISSELGSDAPHLRPISNMQHMREDQIMGDNSSRRNGIEGIDTNITNMIFENLEAGYVPHTYHNYTILRNKTLKKLEELRTKNVTTRINEVFIEIDLLGNYTQSSWFSNLNMYSYITFMQELYDIWRRRANLSLHVRNQICPYYNPFKYQIYNNNTFSSFNLSLNSARNYAVTLIENIVFSGGDIEFRKIGVMHLLSALTLVSIPARESLPWLYDSLTG